MRPNDLFQVLLYLALLLASAPLLARWMCRSLNGQRHFLRPILGPIERAMYALAGVHPEKEMHWRTYLQSLLLFNGLGFLAVFALQVFQASLPLNPQRLPNVPWWLALNTAISFMTNTNWQAYSGEATLSYLVQMAGLGVQNFLSAATGIAVMLALARALGRKTSETIGNFWCDLTRTILYVLLPLSILFALVLAGQGVVQSFDKYRTARTLEGREQIIPSGPAASQVAIKELGTNGGGFFGANSTHPLENPTPLTNFLEMVALLLLPAALPLVYGRMVGNRRHGWCLFGVMLVLFGAGLSVSLKAEHDVLRTRPALAMEGKETRTGMTASAVWATATTAASNGSVNAMHDSMAPLSGLVQLANMMIGEVIFGGVGAGVYGVVLFALLTVFIAGLMVGRTPEYLGKRLDISTIIWAMVGLLLPSAVILVGTAMSCINTGALASRLNSGPHGFSEILYAWTSASANNGSAFAGLNASTVFYCIGLGLAMLLGRFGVIIPAIYVAGHLGGKKTVPPSSGTFPTDTVTFAALLISVILIVGGLIFFPAMSLGPIVEHMLLGQGRFF